MLNQQKTPGQNSQKIQPQIILPKQSQNQSLSKIQQKKKSVHNILTQQSWTNSQQKQKYQKNKLHNKKLQNLTHRTHFMKSIHNTNELILVYLMYKDQKLSLFLNKGVSFDQLLRRMYKQIYIYQKETYSISNAILKNLLYKITGFQSIDNDLLYDYQLKYRRGNLNKQKFFVPFKQEDIKMPFKIYFKLNSSNFYGNQEYLIRNYSDGEWSILTAIKKQNFDDQKLNIIRKSLKINFTSSSLLIKHALPHFSQFNWFQTKNYIFILSEFFPQSLQHHLNKNKYKYLHENLLIILKLIVKWFVNILKLMVQNNIQIFKKIKLRQIGLNALDGYPKLNIIQNVINCIDFGQRRKSVIQNGRRGSEKINDKFYQQTFTNFVQNLKMLINNQLKQNLEAETFLNTIIQFSKGQNFNFQQILKQEMLLDMNITCNIFKKTKNPLNVDFDSRMKSIIEGNNQIKNSTLSSNNSTIQISQIRDQIQKAISLQTIRRNQQRNENKSILQLITSTINGVDLNKQNLFNLTEFKKQEQRKYLLKNKQKLYVQQIINELNQNENFIKTTKQNNLASIQFYLKKSDQKIKRKMISKIQTKYKKFFQPKQTSHFQIQSFQKHPLLVQRTNTISSFNKTSKTKIKNCTSLNYENHLSEESRIQQSFSNDSENLKNGLQSLFQKRYLNKSFQGKVRKAQVQTNKNLKTNKQEIKKTSSTVKTNLSLIEQGQIKRTQKIQQRTSAPKQLSRLLKFKSSKFTSPPHKNRLEQLFVNSKDYLKEEKLELKKKQYGIYLEEAQKQYNKIKIYKKNKSP